MALCATAPGQTAAVSAFIDPIMADLGVSRGQISTAYLVGTLTGALAMPLAGRAIDRHGARRSMAVIAAAFGAALLGLSLVEGLVGLTLGFIGIRMLGRARSGSPRPPPQPGGSPHGADRHSASSPQSEQPASPLLPSSSKG